MKRPLTPQPLKKIYHSKNQTTTIKLRSKEVKYHLNYQYDLQHNEIIICLCRDLIY